MELVKLYSSRISEAKRELIIKQFHAAGRTVVFVPLIPKKSMQRIDEVIKVYMEWAESVRHKNTLKSRVFKTPYLDKADEADQLFEEIERIMPVRAQIDFTAPICMDKGGLCVTSKNVGE